MDQFWAYGPFRDAHNTFLPKLPLCKILEHRVEVKVRVSGGDFAYARARCRRCHRFFGGDGISF